MTRKEDLEKIADDMGPNIRAGMQIDPKPETDAERAARLLGEVNVEKMQAYAKAMIKKFPRATPARIGRMVAKKFKIRLK